jgi:dGTPase
MPGLQELEIWQRARSGVDESDRELRRHRIVRHIVDLLVSDLVYATAENLKGLAPASPDAIREAPGPIAGLSRDVARMQGELKVFLHDRLYRHYRVVRMFRKAERVLRELFVAFEEDYRQLPTATRDHIVRVQPDIRPKGELSAGAYQVIVDYIAGMTDRYAHQEHSRLYDPYTPA